MEVIVLLMIISVNTHIERFVRYLGIPMYLISCLTFTHAHEQNILRAVEKFLASCYWFSRLVDQRTNNKNTKVAIINIYCNYLQQTGELILKQYFKFKKFMTSNQANIWVSMLRKASIRIPRSSIRFSTSYYKWWILYSR